MHWWTWNQYIQAWLWIKTDWSYRSHITVERRMMMMILDAVLWSILTQLSSRAWLVVCFPTLKLLKIRSFEDILELHQEFLRLHWEFLWLCQDFLWILEQFFKNFQGGEIDNYQNMKSSRVKAMRLPTGCKSDCMQVGWWKRPGVYE